MTTRWADWSAEAEAAYQRLAAALRQGRRRRAVDGRHAHAVAGAAASRDRRDRAASTPRRSRSRPRSRDGAGDGRRGHRRHARASAPTSPIRTSTESAYDADAAARRCSRSSRTAWRSQASATARSRCPVLILTSPQDHVVEPANGDFLAADVGGPVERVTLERSYHVATLDYDKDVIFERGGRVRPQGPLTAGRDARARPRARSVDRRCCSPACSASIPSPSNGTIHIGPLQLRAYGLMIALGVLAAVWLAGRRLGAAGHRHPRRHVGDRAVGGARRRHRRPAVPRDHRLAAASRDDWSTSSRSGRAASASGAASRSASPSGIWAAARRGIPLRAGCRCASPRRCRWPRPSAGWGNWWNQELFGRPTDLPWALEVSSDKAVPAGYPPATTFHPDVPLRVAVEPAAVRRADLDRPPVPASGARTAVRAVRRRLHVRALLDRAAAHRRGLAVSGVGGSTRSCRSWCSRSPSCTSWSRCAAPGRTRSEHAVGAQVEVDVEVADADDEPSARAGRAARR